MWNSDTLTLYTLTVTPNYIQHLYSHTHAHHQWWLLAGQSSLFLHYLHGLSYTHFWQQLWFCIMYTLTIQHSLFCPLLRMQLRSCAFRFLITHIWEWDTTHRGNGLRNRCSHSFSFMYGYGNAVPYIFWPIPDKITILYNNCLRFKVSSWVGIEYDFAELTHKGVCMLKLHIGILYTRRSTVFERRELKLGKTWSMHCQGI